MPLYEYQCQACGKVSEINHRMSDPPASVCPVCGKPALEKLISAAGFRLKGGGWYETDFKSGDKRNIASDTSSGGSSSSSAESCSPSGCAACAPTAGNA